MRKPSQRGPSTLTGGVKEGYLWAVPQTMREALAVHFGELWPSEVEIPAPTRWILTAASPTEAFGSPDWLVTDYLLSLGTKPFALLSGISGTGKTKLAQLVAGYFAPPEQVDEAATEPPPTPEDGFVHVVGLSTLKAGLSIPKAARLLCFPRCPPARSESVASRLKVYAPPAGLARAGL